MKFLWLLIVGLFFAASPMQAQSDSLYYNSYFSQITGRFYFSQKYTSLILKNEDPNLNLTYRPNTNFNMGIGATYNWFTLNLAYGFNFLNNDEEKGETNYLDLQAHFYGQKFNIDMFGQFYKGFYLYPEGKATVENEYYVRPDLRVTELGASLQYVFNDKKLSMRASSVQSQRQLKSAGSPLLGLELYFGVVRADSSIYPKTILEDTLNNKQITFVEAGPSLGYAYTFVFLKNFFFTASAAANIDINFTNYISDLGTDTKSGISPNGMLRFFAGYNTDRNAISLTFTNNTVRLSNTHDTRVTLNTGNFRLNFIRRFPPRKNKNAILKTIDKLGR